MTPRFDHEMRALRDKRAALDEQGTALVRALSALMDEALRAIWEQLDTSGLALIALGGYGRGELSPHSDIDLMVLHEDEARARPASEAVFYALWDAGFDVGHSVRTPKECARLARANLEAETSFLHARLIAGDATLSARFATDSVNATRRRAQKFVQDVRRMIADRHERSGSATSQLEPNIKEGSGGLRDLHVLGWLARASNQAVLEANEEVRVAGAAELLHRVRNELHRSADRGNDVLAFDLQRAVAMALGYSDADRPAEDLLMRDLFAATRTIEHTVAAVLADACADDSKSVRGRPFEILDARVVVVGEPDLRSSPHLALDLFCLDAQPGASALRWLAHALGDSLPWTPEVRASFFSMLGCFNSTRLELADHAGLFARLLPEWDAVRCQPQRNVYHRFTVDAHLFNSVAAVGTLDDEQLARDTLGELDDPDALLLACLLHDVGKGTAEDHAIRGGEVARAMLDRMGIGEPRRGTVTWLVRHHLLLVEAATRRDLNDENFIVDVAGRIGDIERARLLYLLSIADGRATGPAAWSPWKAALVSELFLKVTHVLERGDLASRESVEVARMRASELRRALTRYDEATVVAHIDGMPRAYILAFPTPGLVQHFALMAEPLTADDVRAQLQQPDEPGVYEYSLVARDRPGLFSTVSGVLAMNGIGIVGAQAFTRADGVAIEIFRCVGAFEPTIERDRWQRVENDVRGALSGVLALKDRLEKQRAESMPQSARSTHLPRVVVDNTASDFLTVVEVHAPDRHGLLCEITSVFAELETDIQVAKIATYGNDIVDVFYVRDLDGQKIADPVRRDEIEHALMRALLRSGGT